MKKEELMKYVGSLQQVAYVRPMTYTEGRSHGLSAYEIKNGCMELQVMADKALDVNQLSYKGINTTQTETRRSVPSWEDCFLPPVLRASVRHVPLTM